MTLCIRNKTVQGDTYRGVFEKAHVYRGKPQTCVRIPSSGKSLLGHNAFVWFEVSIYITCLSNAWHNASILLAQWFAKWPRAEFLFVSCPERKNWAFWALGGMTEVVYRPLCVP